MSYCEFILLMLIFLVFFGQFFLFLGTMEAASNTTQNTRRVSLESTMEALTNMSCIIKNMEENMTTISDA